MMMHARGASEPAPHSDGNEAPSISSYFPAAKQHGAAQPHRAPLMDLSNQGPGGGGRRGEKRHHSQQVAGEKSFAYHMDEGAENTACGPHTGTRGGFGPADEGVESFADASCYPGESMETDTPQHQPPKRQAPLQQQQQQRNRYPRVAPSGQQSTFSAPFSVYQDGEVEDVDHGSSSVPATTSTMTSTTTSAPTSGLAEKEGREVEEDEEMAEPMDEENALHRNEGGFPQFPTHMEEEHGVERIRYGGEDGSMEVEEPVHVLPSQNQSPAEEFAARAQLMSNPQLVMEYRDDIYNHQRDLETRHLPNRFYMNSQTDINARMRGILFDWLVEVALDYTLSPETLHLSFNYIDRYLSRVAVNRTRLQLVGITCMFLASKYEEISPPSVESFVYMTENTYDREDVFRMEVRVLRYLEFNLSVVTSHTFVQRLTEVSCIDEGDSMYVTRIQQLTCYFLELAAMEYEMIKWYPSIVTTSAIALARYALGLSYWSNEFEQESRYTPEDVSLCMQDLLFLWKRAAGHRLKAVPEKYRSAECGCVASIPPPQDIPAMFMFD